ncbi:MAG: hypothetical protein M3Z26_04725 [Bacteroidota bacterium]|nr:hypothetical protein [Bacteroidota bacterium]
MSVTENKKLKKRIIKIRKTKNLKNEGVDTSKYCGILKLKEDPLIIQKKLRDEWK